MRRCPGSCGEGIRRDQVLISAGSKVKRFWVYELREDMQRCVQDISVLFLCLSQSGLLYYIPLGTGQLQWGGYEQLPRVTACQG